MHACLIINKYKKNSYGHKTLARFLDKIDQKARGDIVVGFIPTLIQLHILYWIYSYNNPSNHTLIGFSTSLIQLHTFLLGLLLQ